MKKLHPAAIANMVLWVAAIIASALILRGHPSANIVVVVLGGAAGVSILLVSEALNKSQVGPSNEHHQLDP